MPNNKEQHASHRSSLAVSTVTFKPMIRNYHFLQLSVQRMAANTEKLIQLIDQLPTDPLSTDNPSECRTNQDISSSLPRL